MYINSFYTYCLEDLPVFTFPDHSENSLSSPQETLHEDSSIREGHPPVANISDGQDGGFH